MPKRVVRVAECLAGVAITVGVALLILGQEWGLDIVLAGQGVLLAALLFEWYRTRGEPPPERRA